MSDLRSAPRGWVWCKLGEIAEVQLGKMLSEKARAAGLEQRPYLRNQNVRWGTLDLADVKSMGFKPHEVARYSVEPGDLLVCEGGEPARCAVYNGPPRMFMYQKALHRVRPREGTTDPRFLQHCLWHYASNGVVLPRPSETTIQHLPLEKMEALPVPLPPFAEQRRIVEALETHFTRLDAAVASLERVRANLRRYRAAVLHAAVEGRLVGSDSTTWEERTAADWCCDIASGSTPAAQHISKGAGEVPFIRVQHLGFDSRLRFSAAPSYVSAAVHRTKMRRSTTLPGDVLFNIVGPPLGKSALVPHGFPEANINQAIVRFRCGPRLRPRFLALVLASPAVERWATRTARATAGQFNLAVTECRLHRFRVPPVELQDRIVSDADARISRLEVAEAALAVAAQRIGALRQSLLRAAFEGRLVPQDPCDEPADVLLARIRAERAAAAPAASATSRRRGRPRARRTPA